MGGISVLRVPATRPSIRRTAHSRETLGRDPDLPGPRRKSFLDSLWRGQRDTRKDAKYLVRDMKEIRLDYHY